LLPPSLFEHLWTIRRSSARIAGKDDDQDKHLDRGVSFDTTFDGAGVLHGDLTPECAAMVQAVLDAPSAPQGDGDLSTRSQRYHDALEEAMRRLLASDLLPQRAGQPVKALVHISFAERVQEAGVPRGAGRGATRFVIPR
jgi:Domain of unknown function (DUF222)